MKKYGLHLLVLVAITSLLCGCKDNRVKAELGQDFSLAIGQSAVITGEELEITFEKVTEDSRCPTGVVCEWEGMVACVLKITEGGTTYGIELAQPGLSTGYAQETYKEYKFTFKVEPYPESGNEIPSNEYQILLEISKL
jgi:hypothetical protein